MSLLPLGSQSGRRDVCVSICLMPVQDVEPEDVRLVFEGQEIAIYPHLLSGNVEPEDRRTRDGSSMPGWCNMIPLVPVQSSTELYAQIKVSSRVPAMSQLTFLSMLSVRELTGTGAWTVAQVRRTCRVSLSAA